MPFIHGKLTQFPLLAYTVGSTYKEIHIHFEELGSEGGTEHQENELGMLLVVLDVNTSNLFSS